MGLDLNDSFTILPIYVYAYLSILASFKKTVPQQSLYRDEKILVVKFSVQGCFAVWYSSVNIEP